MRQRSSVALSRLQQPKFLGALKAPFSLICSTTGLTSCPGKRHWPNWVRLGLAAFAPMVSARRLSRKCGNDEGKSETCAICHQTFASRSGLFRHLRKEHPATHNCTCDRCGTFPVHGTCYKSQEAHQMLCSKCYELSEGDPNFDPHLFSRHDCPQHMEQNSEAPKTDKTPKILVSDLPRTRSPLEFGSSSQLPQSLVDVFNRFASAERPTFRIPSKTLRNEVPFEDLEFAWSNQLLFGMPIGIKSTFAHEERDQWLHLAKENPDGDVALSPLEPELTSGLLLAILRFQMSQTETSCKDIRRIAKSTWNCRHSAEDWQACAETTLGSLGVSIKRQRGSSGHKSPSIALQHKDPVKQPLDFEAFTFSFLQSVNGEEFYSTPSIAESMFHYGQSLEQCIVPLDMCYSLVSLARQSPYIQRCENGRSNDALIVKLDLVQCPGDSGDDAACVVAYHDKRANSFTNTSESAEYEMVIGQIRVQKFLLSEASWTWNLSGFCNILCFLCVTSFWLYNFVWFLICLYF